MGTSCMEKSGNRLRSRASWLLSQPFHGIRYDNRRRCAVDWACQSWDIERIELFAHLTSLRPKYDWAWPPCLLPCIYTFIYTFICIYIYTQLLTFLLTCIYMCVCVHTMHPSIQPYRTWIWVFRHIILHKNWLPSPYIWTCTCSPIHLGRANLFLQERKTYVQHRILEHAALLSSILHDAVICVAG